MYLDEETQIHRIAFALTKFENKNAQLYMFICPMDLNTADHESRNGREATRTRGNSFLCNIGCAD